MLTSLFRDRLNCQVFRTLGSHHASRHSMFFCSVVSFMLEYMASIILSRIPFFCDTLERLCVLENVRSLHRHSGEKKMSEISILG